MKQRLLIFIFAISCCEALCFATVTQNYHSRVVRVDDGNTLVVSNKVLRGSITLLGESMVILDGVRAPNLDQPGGAEARAFLEGLVKGKEIFVVELTDMGKSRGAWVFINDGECINLHLVEEGHAWLINPRSHFAVSFGKPKEAYGKLTNAFQKAKEQKRGIWAADNPIPPWEWKKQRKDDDN